MSHHILAFQQWLEEDGKARKTIETYGSNIKNYFSFKDNYANEDDEMLSRYLVVRYIKHLEKENYAISSTNAKVTSLLAFNKFLLEQNLVDQLFVSLRKDQLKLAVGSEQVVEAFSEDEVGKLLTYVETREKVNSRNKSIIHLLLYSGMRISELCSVKLSDIDFLTSTLFVKGKGGKYREITLRQDVVEVIQHYIKTERVHSKFQPSPYLLVSNRAEKLHRDGVNNWMKVVSSDVGFKVYPHKFRRTFATILLNKGVLINTVAKLMGITIAVLEKHYVQTSRQDKMKAVELL